MKGKTGPEESFVYCIVKKRHRAYDKLSMRASYVRYDLFVEDCDTYST